MLKKVEHYCLQEGLLANNTTVIIGLSGGPDSVFLTYFLHSVQKKYNLTLIAAHLNHGWRQDAINDEQFCRDLAASLGLPFIAAHAQDIKITRKVTGSQEDLGRQLRRIFFERIHREHNAHAIALAHHQDDAIETFFIRLLRGAGVTGLASIRARNKEYIRPLLCVTKQELLDYLTHNNIRYCTDTTNEYDAYLRNRVRKYLIPAAIECDARAPKTMVNTIEQLQAADDFLDTLTRETYAHIAPNNILSLVKLSTLHPFLQKRILLTWLCANTVPFTPSESFFSELLRFLLRSTATQHIISSWVIVKKNNYASIMQQ